MSPLVFLGLAVVIAVLGIGLSVLLHHRPRSRHSGIDAFTREMQALAPRDRPPPPPPTQER